MYFLTLEIFICIMTIFPVLSAQKGIDWNYWIPIGVKIVARTPYDADYIIILLSTRQIFTLVSRPTSLMSILFIIHCCTVNIWKVFNKKKLAHNETVDTEHLFNSMYGDCIFLITQLYKLKLHRCARFFLIPIEHFPD